MALCYGEYRGRTVKGFVRYCLARIKAYHKDLSFKSYVTDCLSMLCGTNVRWYDMVSGEKTQVEKNQDEAEQIMQRLRDNFYRKEDKQ